MDEFYEGSEILVTFVHILSLLFIILVGTFTIDVLSVEEKVLTIGFTLEFTRIRRR